MSLVHGAKDKRLEQRVTEAQRQLIQRGADAKGKSLSEFVIESSCLAAEMAILDQRITFVEPDVFDRFSQRLDEESQSLDGLTDLFEKKAPWIA